MAKKRKKDKVFVRGPKGGLFKSWIYIPKRLGVDNSEKV